MNKDSLESLRSILSIHTKIGDVGGGYLIAEKVDIL